MAGDANWYFTHETAQDRRWYQIFFSMCKKFGVSWATASSAEKAFIEELTRVNFERELAKRDNSQKAVRGFFDGSTSVPA